MYFMLEWEKKTHEKICSFSSSFFSAEIAVLRKEATLSNTKSVYTTTKIEYIS